MVEFVGILNMTPDSFSDGGQFVHLDIDGSEIVDEDAAILFARELFRDGASFVDVGGESTRPGATPLTSKQELHRIELVAAHLIRRMPGQIFIDSYHPETHRHLAKARLGKFIINDVTGFNNPEMRVVAAELGMVCVISHLPFIFGTDIQAAHKGGNKLMSNIDDVVGEVLQRRKELMKMGVPSAKIIVDPGIGFGKTPELNGQLLTFPEYVKAREPDVKVMLGYSKKRFLGDHRFDLEPNLEAGRTAIEHKADLLRVHDVAGHQKLLSTT